MYDPMLVLVLYPYRWVRCLFLLVMPIYGTSHTFQGIYSFIVTFSRPRSTSAIELHQLLIVVLQVVAVFQMLKQVSCSGSLGPVNAVSQSRKHTR